MDFGDTPVAIGRGAKVTDESDSLIKVARIIYEALTPFHDVALK